MRMVLFVGLGLVLGAVGGAVIGFLIGMLLVEIFSISCFEGACGFFAVSIGLLGFFIGAIGGLTVGILLGRRRASTA
ncbi:MAG: hypothetical protein KIT36_13505 [Alphaproteobacteria bacterium]|nr:hypothetical protein [Alphaproteobacteria bacterium]